MCSVPAGADQWAGGGGGVLGVRTPPPPPFWGTAKLHEEGKNVAEFTICKTGFKDLNLEHNMIYYVHLPTKITST